MILTFKLDLDSVKVISFESYRPRTHRQTDRLTHTHTHTHTHTRPFTHLHYEPHSRFGDLRSASLPADRRVRSDPSPAPRCRLSGRGAPTAAVTCLECSLGAQPTPVWPSVQDSITRGTARCPQTNFVRISIRYPASGRQQYRAFIAAPILCAVLYAIIQDCMVSGEGKSN